MKMGVNFFVISEQSGESRNLFNLLPLIKSSYTLGEKLMVFIEFKNEILRPYGLRMTVKG
jgi:hypothetical protein